MLTNRTSGDLSGTRVSEERPILVLRNLRGRGEEARKDRETDQAGVVAVHFIAEPGEAVSVLADHAGEVEGRSIRVNNAVPDYLYAVLAVADPGVVDADEARALRDQEIAPRGGVVDIRGDKPSVRSAEDLDSGALTYAEIKAIASGNPAVVEKIKIDTEIRKLDQLRAVHANQQRHIRWEIRDLRKRTAWAH